MEETNPKEVDLLEILAAFYASIMRNLVLSVALPILGAILAIVLTIGIGEKYESSLLIETSLLTENESKFLFDQLDKLGVIPGLTPQQDAQVNELAFKVIPNNRNPDLSLNETSLYLQVTASVSDRSVFPALEGAIVKFVNNSPPVIRHRTERQKFYDELIGKIDSEISAMDNVKKEVGNKTQATYLDPSQLYVETVELFREKMKLEIKRGEINSVHLIKGFDTLSIDKKPNLILVGIVGFIAGFFLLCLVLFAKFFASYYKMYKKSHAGS